MDSHSLSMEQEVSKNIEENEREVSKNIEENERKASKNIEENERQVSKNIEENEREACKNIAVNIVENEREVSDNIEENEREASNNIEENEQKAWKNIEVNIVENEREASENIEENEREASNNTEEENEQKAWKNIEMNIVENERGFVELTNLKNAAREIVACIVAASFHIAMGISMAYPATLIPHLKKEEAKMHATKKQISWTGNLNLNVGWISIGAPLTNFPMNSTSIRLSDNLNINVGWILIGALLTGYLMDTIGRLRALQIGAILCVIGWILIAIATNMPMLLVGHLLSRLTTALATSSAIVYITEMARPKLRGSMICFGLTLEFSGRQLYLSYVNLHWRLIACLNTIYMVVLIIAMQFLMPESPVWLVSKGLIDDARKSLEWLYKNETSQGKTSMAELQFNTIMKENEIKLNEQRRSKYGSMSNKLPGFLKPTRWKPMVILFLLFSFQQFSVNDFYVMLCFSEVSASVDYDLMRDCLIVTYFLCSMVSIWLLWRYKRRPLCIISSLGMTVCMIVSGYFTLKMKNYDNNGYWVPVICLLLYVCASKVGMSTVPWIMTAELFPTEIRGIAHSISYSMARLLKFAVYKYYKSLLNFLEGTYVQWCFVGVSMGAAVFVLLMLPETHGKKLSEIEEYFQNNFLALGAEAKDEKRRAKRKAQQNAKSTELFNLRPMQSLA